MAILTGPEILNQVHKGAIKIEPFDPTLIGPNSIDLHLGDRMLVYKSKRVRADDGNLEDYISGATFTHEGRTWVPWKGKYHRAIDSKSPPPTQEIEPSHGGGWLLVPGRLYLGMTKEYTETRGFVPYIDGRSSFGRLGVFLHVTAGRGDNGFCGNWTLELAVVEPVIVYPGQRVAQLTYHTIEGEESLYGRTTNSSGRYQGDRGPVASKIHK